MKNKNKNTTYDYMVLTFFFFLLITILYLVYFLFLKTDQMKKNTSQYNLTEHGFCVIKKVFQKDKIGNLRELCEKGDYKQAKQFLLQDSQLREIIYQQTKDSGYQFQDYIWIIQKSSVHTCHRDNNGDFFNKGQKYPSYTMLLYLEDMEKCLGVIPQSHLDRNSYNINITDQVKNLVCKEGDIILFNANLIHVGTINASKNDHLRIQMKVSHKEDLQVLSYYQNYNKVLKEENKLPTFLRNAQKNLSCMFPIVSNLTQKENIMSARGSDNGAQIPWFQKVFSYFFYGNSHFYDLPNAF